MITHGFKVFYLVISEIFKNICLNFSFEKEGFLIPAILLKAAGVVMKGFQKTL
jgi:hypothetical protein